MSAEERPSATIVRLPTAPARKIRQPVLDRDRGVPGKALSSSENVVQLHARVPTLRWAPETAVGLMHKIRYTAIELGCFDPADPDCANKLAASKHRTSALMLLLHNDARTLARKEYELQAASINTKTRKHSKKSKR